MKFDRKKFFNGFKPWYKIVTGENLDSDKVQALDFLLTNFENSSEWQSVNQIAYALATIHIETFWPQSGKRYEPIREGGGKSYFIKRYWTNVKIRNQLGNKSQYDAYARSGRGYVQLTGLSNDQKMSKLLGIDLISNPDLAMNPETAFKIMTVGMMNGIFTGKKLGTYVTETKRDYVKARGVINGVDRAREIANYAESIEDILRGAFISNSNTSKLVEKTGLSESVTKEEIGEPLSTEGIENGSNHGVTAPPPSLVPVVTSVIEVEQVTAAPEETKTEEKTDVAVSIGNKITAVWTAVGTTLVAIGTFLTSTPLGIAISIIIAVALIGAIYMFINWRRNENKEKREAAEKLERTRLENELKLKREQQAFELQKLTLESAMRKDLNTVRLVPPPTEMPNSDQEGK